MLSWEFVLSLLLAYLLGSIPFAYIIGKYRNIDIRNEGDRNAGAFNIFRHAGLSADLVTLCCDIAKGAVAVILAQIIMQGIQDSEILVLVAGIAALIGHNFPVFLGFHGGRGVSTVVGVLLILLPVEMFIAFICAIFVILSTKNSILGGIVLFVPVPVLAILINEPWYLIIYSVLLPVITGIAHLISTRKLSQIEKKESGTFWISS